MDTLAEKMFADQQYKNPSQAIIPSTGRQFTLKQDFYATVKKGTKLFLKLEDNRLVVQERCNRYLQVLKGVAVSESKNNDL